MARNPTERGGECDLELGGYAVSWTSSTWSQPTFQDLLQVLYYSGFKGVMQSLYRCNALQ